MPTHIHLFFFSGDLKKDKSLIQYARKAGLAANQRWEYRDGYIFPQAAPHLVLDIRVWITFFGHLGDVERERGEGERYIWVFWKRGVRQTTNGRK